MKMPTLMRSTTVSGMVVPLAGEGDTGRTRDVFLLMHRNGGGAMSLAFVAIMSCDDAQSSPRPAPS